MPLQLRTLLFGLAVIFLSSCHNMPDHARYIPKDAVVVAGLNTKEIGKEIAWSALVGSKLFEQMKARLPQHTAMEDLGNAGIRHMSTSYLYVRNSQADSRVRITAIIPLEDETKWEAYVQKTFTAATITSAGDRKEAKLVNGMYAGWTKDVLIVMNLLDRSEPELLPVDTINLEEMSADADRATVMPPAAAPREVDEATLAAEMQQAFSVEKTNTLTDDKRFKKLESKGHDMTLWINYESLMNQNAAKMGMPSELALSGTLWAGSAFAAGFDFEKGKITGDMEYYISDAIKDIAKKFGAARVSAETMERLPAHDLDMLLAFGMSPEGTRAMLEKLGVLGFVNLALADQGLTTDDILQAFDGEMALAVNDFSVSYKNTTYTTSDSATVNYTGSFPSMNVLYAMKIGKREKFDKLMTWLEGKSLITAKGNNVYAVLNDSVFLVKGDQYLAISNRLETAQGFLSGSYKKEAKPAIVGNELKGQPLGFFVDFQKLLGAVQPSALTDSTQIRALAETKRLLNNMTVTGGAYESDAFHYQMSVNFMNHEENSIFQLMNYAMMLNPSTPQPRQPI